MATAVFVPTSSVLTINSVDLSDQCQSAVMRYEKEALAKDTIASTARTFTAGLENNTCSVTLMQSYASSEPWATLKSLIGTTTTVTIKVASGSASATNPVHTLTGAYLAGLDVYNSAAGELSQVVAEFTGGSYTTVEV